MNTQLFIPQEIIVGQQNRSDTYTKRLGFVAPIKKGEDPNKRMGWVNWRDKSIEPLRLNNEPTESFVLNKNGGGRGGGWDARRAFMRVFDPRGFEFEIGIANLTFILEYCDCMRGKGIDGSFVYAWEGKDLILLPTNCQEYISSEDFSNLKGMKVSAKELLPGRTYKTKDQKDAIYLGQYNWLEKRAYYNDASLSKEHIFSVDNEFEAIKADKIAKITDETCIQGFSDIIEKLEKSKMISNFVSITIEPANIKYINNSYSMNHAVEGTFYQKIGDTNVYKGFRIMQNNKIVASNKSYYIREYTLDFYTIKQVSLLTIDDNKITAIRSKAVKDETQYSKEEINSMGFVKFLTEKVLKESYNYSTNKNETKLVSFYVI